MDRHGVKDLDELMSRSTEDIAWFWDAVLQDLDIQFYEPYSQVVDLSAGYPWPRWCVDGQMNIVHNCLDKWMGTPTQNRLAIRWEGEEGNVRLLTYRDLWREVNRTANALRALGLGKGDAIGLYMPMVPEIAVALLAIAKIGGVILPLFSGFGAGAIATRLADAGARALFTADGTYRRGKVVPMKPTADEALRDLPGLEHVIVYRRVGDAAPASEPSGWLPARDHWWHDLIPDQPATAETERTSAEDLLMIIYTSGTTGRPKGAVHTHCGFPVKSAQDMYHSFDVKPSDTMYWMTDMGWMMGPWEVFGITLLGGTFVLYDGAPDYLEVDRTWAMVEEHGVTILGLSPTFVRAIIPHGEEAVQRHDLSSLRALGSTGEPWNPDPWLWTFNVVGGGRIPILNYSGGTEVSGGIVGGNLLTPLKPCAFSGPVPGMAADVVDDEGNSVRNQVGELVVRKPWIGMTRGFWQDPERYIQSYWARYPNVWVHGDWSAIDEDGLWYILGRSDDVIKVAGKRLGPAEVESVVVSHPAVVEAAAIAVPDPVKGQSVVVFVVLTPDGAPSNALRDEIQHHVVQELGKPLAPKEVKFVRDLPKTRNAKVMRRMVRAAYLGEDAGDTSALVNPEAVEEIRRAV
ncbi:MAG TPA: AMP-dependent synthetase [Chloroflexi bacterium]|nr:AMP-dependent synthetase [Chloroflexota bacterium]